MADESKNSGHCNSGHYNSGNYNSGHYNSGDRNSGHCNSGNYNSGNRNSGHCNSGNCNSGHRNSGDYNSGNYNSGDYNSGDYNSGDYNSGNYNSGFFCTDSPSPRFFDEPTSLTWGEAEELIPYIDLPVGCQWVPTKDMSDAEKRDNPLHVTTGGFLRVDTRPIRETFPLAWAKLSEDERARWLALPNFNAEKFLAITGVDVRKAERTIRIKLASGQTVELVGEIVE